MSLTLRGGGAAEAFQTLLKTQSYVSAITQHGTADDCNLHTSASTPVSNAWRRRSAWRLRPAFISSRQVLRWRSGMYF